MSSVGEQQSGSTTSSESAISENGNTICTPKLNTDIFIDTIPAEYSYVQWPGQINDVAEEYIATLQSRDDSYTFRSKDYVIIVIRGGHDPATIPDEELLVTIPDSSSGVAATDADRAQAWHIPRKYLTFGSRAIDDVKIIFDTRSMSLPRLPSFIKKTQWMSHGERIVRGLLWVLFQNAEFLVCLGCGNTYFEYLQENYLAACREIWEGSHEVVSDIL